MERTYATVKGTRPYDSTHRREQALQTRAAIIGGARRLFLRDGYSSTTVASIAAEIGVSVDTIYKSFGGKAGLVQAICDQALAGEGAVTAEHRSDELQASEADPRQIIRGWGNLTMEVAPRVAPILLLVRVAASADRAMANLRTELDAQRLERMMHNAGSLHVRGHLRDTVTVEQAGEILWTYSSPELYELTVITRGWPLSRYADFIVDAMIAALLPSETVTPPATRHLTPLMGAHPEPATAPRPGHEGPQPIECKGGR